LSFVEKIRKMLGLLTILVLASSALGDLSRFRRQSDFCKRCDSQDSYVSKNIDHSDWMYSQKDKLSSKRLVDLKMIGTHHSSSYSFNQFFDSYSVCQNTHIANQLKAGVRYIDLRIGSYLNSLRIGHAIHFGSLAQDILKEVLNFIKAHPKEFLILNIRDSDWTPIPANQKRDLINLVKSTFADLMVTSGDSWFDLSSVTLGQIWEHNRSVYVIYGDKLLWSVDLADGQGARNLSQSDADSWGLRAIQNVYDPWPNTANIDELFNKATAFYDRRPNPRDKFYVAQLLLTANPLQTKTLDKLTQDLQQTGRIRQFLNEHPEYAIVYVDFFLGVTDKERQYARDLLEAVIAAN